MPRRKLGRLDLRVPSRGREGVGGEAHRRRQHGAQSHAGYHASRRAGEPVRNRGLGRMWTRLERDWPSSTDEGVQLQAGARRGVIVVPW